MLVTSLPLLGQVNPEVIFQDLQHKFYTYKKPTTDTVYTGFSECFEVNIGGCEQRWPGYDTHQLLNILRDYVKQNKCNSKTKYSFN